MRAPLGAAATALAVLPFAAGAEPPRVATDIAPVHSLVARVMDGVGEPDLLVQPGMSEHDSALRPSDARALEQADVVIWMGPGLTPWLEGAIGNLARDAEVVRLLEAEGTRVLPTRDDPLFEARDHEDQEAHAEEDHAHAHAHAHDEMDPHAWLDPRNAGAWLEVIAERLGGTDPENAEAYRANAEAGQAELAALEDEIAAMLEPFRGTPYLVFHDAYQYFEARFDVPAQGALAVSDASDPGPARLSAIRDAVAEREVVCAFAEPQYDPGLLAAVAGGVATAVIDPLGAALEPGPDLYPALLRGIADSMLGCL